MSKDPLIFRKLPLSCALLLRWCYFSGELSYLLDEINGARSLVANRIALVHYLLEISNRLVLRLTTSVCETQQLRWGIAVELARQLHIH